MAENESGRDNFLRGLLIGGILGALAGILFAPKSGKELRSDLKQKGSEVLGDAREFYSEAQVKAKAVLEDAWHRAEDLKKEANRQLAEARTKAREILRDAGEKASEVGELAKEAMGEAKTEVKKVKGAVEAGLEAAKQELSKGKDKGETQA